MLKEDALKMITLNPAIQLGIDEKVGSLEEGKQGDVSIWNKHPLSIYSMAEMTFVDGIKYFDKEEDDSDMRIDIDPNEEFTQPTNRIISHGHQGAACMHDTFYLFSESSSN